MQESFVYDKFQRVNMSHPVGSFVNILVLGDAGAGKTTLCHVIRDKSLVSLSIVEKCTRAIKKAFGGDMKIPQVKNSTAGIIPTKFHGKHLGNVIVHDFAGQPEYFSSHAAVAENLLQQCGAVFVIVINLTQNLSQQIQYWLNMYTNEHQKVSSECHLIVIGSHADKIEQSKLKHLLSHLESCASKELSKSGFKVDTCIFSLDCRLLSGGNLKAFISKLSSLCMSIRNKQSPRISLYCNFLYSLLEAKASDSNVWALHELTDLCDKSRQEGVILPDDIVPSLKTLHSTGLIMYLENGKDIKKSWVVVSREILLTEVNGILFAPSNFVEHADIASNTGIITVGALQQLFSHHSIDMLIMFLKSMKLCEEFDETILKATSLESIASNDIDCHEKLLFFPSLIDEKRPQELNSRNFTLGWCYRTNLSASFPVRFLHVLLLHLAYGYALPVSSVCPLLPPGLQRRCFVWINGIHWYNDDGVEILVEQVEDNQCVIVLMSSESSAEEDIVQLHCKLIHSITSLQHEYCPMLQCTEYLIDPSELHYPLDNPSQLTCYSMENIISHICKGKKFILCESKFEKGPIKIIDILSIEPRKYWSIFKKLHNSSALVTNTGKVLNTCNV